MYVYHLFHEVEGKRTPEVSYTQVYYEFRHFVAKFIVHLGVTFCEIFRCTNNVKRAAPFIVHLDLTPREEATPAIVLAEQKSRKFLFLYNASQSPDR